MALQSITLMLAVAGLASAQSPGLPPICLGQGVGSCNLSVYWSKIIPDQGVSTIEIYDHNCNRIGRGENVQVKVNPCVFSQLPYAVCVDFNSASYTKSGDHGQFYGPPIVVTFQARYGGESVGSAIVGGDCSCGTNTDTAEAACLCGFDC